MAELTASGISTELVGRRVRLRALREEDYEAWHEVRTRCRDWLLPWEPRPAGAPYPSEDRTTFTTRCSMRERGSSAPATASASSPWGALPAR